MAEGLHFKPFSDEGGFITKTTSGTRGNLHPAIRELFQNALDATVEESVSVDLYIRRVSTNLIPYRSAYQAHLRSALDYQRQVPASDKSIELGEKMLACIDGSEIDVLYCQDNGDGIKRNGMRALLSEGNTTKRDTDNAGSYGLGHLQAFGPSDLRYLLYASKYMDEENGIKELASGHTYLADHVLDDNNWGRQGFILDSEVKNEPGEPEEYLTALPDFLQSEFPADFETGSVISVLGFNNFGISEDETGGYGELAKMLKEVCVNNFWMAISKGKLEVRFHDYRSGGATWELSKNTIATHITGKDISETGKRELPTSIDAKLAYDTYNNPEVIRKDIVRGVSIYIRKSTDGKHRVFLFRKGMWIARNPKRLARFPRINPFHCVILIDNDPARKVFRDAEGELHLGIDENEIISDEDKKSFNSHLEKIRNYIKEWAGEVKASKVVYPAIGKILKRRKAVRKSKRPKHVPSGGGGGGGGGGGSNPPNAPKSGRPVDGIRFSTFDNLDATNMITGILIDYSVSAGEYANLGMGVRIYKDDGSDISCQSPAKTEWVILENTTEKFEEHVIATDDGNIELNFADKFTSDTKFKVDFVKRKVAT